MRPDMNAPSQLPMGKLIRGIVFAFAGCGVLGVLGMVGPDGGPLVSTVQAAQPILVPHRAVYSMRLETSRDNSVVGASGEMRYELTASCTGWNSRLASDMNISFSDGRDVNRRWVLEALETADGSVFDFFTRDTYDGQTIEQIEGTALGAKQGAGSDPGTVMYVQPEDRASQTLPQGTLFPNAHTLAVLDAAVAGKRLLPALVFDGGGEDGPVQTMSTIGEELPATEPGELTDPLLETPSWRISMAFFDADQGQAEPNYEIQLRYHLNGVAQGLVQDFQSFSVKGTLTQLEALEVPDC